jgi:hypothetical protein
MRKILLALFVVTLAAPACTDNRRGSSSATEVRPGQLPPGAPGTTPLLEPQAGPQQRR